MERYVYTAEGCDDRLISCLEEDGYSAVCVRTEGLTAGPLSRHPDMFMCRLGISDEAPIISCLDLPGLDAPNAALPGQSYPQDIIYNAACTGRYFIHNLKFTAPALLTAARDLGMELIDVRQGYTKCSTVIVDGSSVITYDKAIAAPCSAAGLDVLLIRPGHIRLPGYDTGFIGGTSGRLGDTVYFNGDLTSHPDCSAIISFIESKGLRLKWFREWPLTDIGSLI